MALSVSEKILNRLTSMFIGEGVKVVKNNLFNHAVFKKPIETSSIEEKCIKRYGWFHPNLIIDPKGNIVNNLQNYTLILEHLFPQLRYSILDRKNFFGNNPIEELDIRSIKKALETFLSKSIQKIACEQAIADVAQQSKFNPIKEYFEGLNKINTSYLDNWLVLLLGCEDTELNRILGRKWLISAVARGCDPGCYTEGSLILIGDTGLGKSRFLRDLNPDSRWFCDARVDISNDQKACQTYQGSFIIEFSELAELNTRTIEEIKSYLTRQVDKYVPKYENLNVEIPRMCIFAGSSNSKKILKDTLGNRRFWCVEAVQYNHKLMEEIKESLWAEAYQAYKAGETWTLTKEELELLNNSNKSFEINKE